MNEFALAFVIIMLILLVTALFVVFGVEAAYLTTLEDCRLILLGYSPITGEPQGFVIQEVKTCQHLLIDNNDEVVNFTK